ncbi:DUF1097 domain-containing protein, partial [Desulfosporosinus metallidurans]|uniref:DUF1097 domain-containing protein n=1 Tax=Desulfosporosinus metallidurans TaxID=1888891 RepID=UPI00094D0053
MAIPLWLTVGLLAGLWMPVSGALGVAPWPLFIAWAAFFAAGADMNAMKKVYPSLLLGVVCGYLTIYFGAIQLAPVLGTIGVPLFVGLFAALLVIMGKFNIFALTPAAFFGFAVYFGIGANLKATLIGLLLGPILGY